MTGRLALEYAAERDACGDPEGAECMRDLAISISVIALDKPDLRELTIQERPY